MSSAFSLRCRKHLVLLAVSVLLLGPLAPSVMPSVEGSLVSYNLFGTAGGWGFTSTVTSPGPTLNALPGGTVLLTLRGADNAPHNFFVDYNVNNVVDPGEPVSANFQGSASPVSFSFVATTTTGSYHYACEYHTNNQWGTFTVTSGSLLHYNLHGAVQGWGFTPTVSSPGPALTTASGATVVVTLTGADTAPHDFFVDYNGNNVADPAEPVSPNFQGSASSMSFSFTATTSPGTYTYRCEYHTAQFGTFTVTSDHVPYHTLYGSAQGWGSTPTVSSPGPTLAAISGGPVVLALLGADTAPHNFFVDYNANNVADTGEPVSADFRGQSSALSFTFTASTTPGTYRYVCEYHSNNQFGTFVILFPSSEFIYDWADLDNNNIVSITDVADAAFKFDQPDNYWDLDLSGKVDITDIAQLAFRFDQSSTMVPYPGQGQPARVMDPTWKYGCNLLPQLERNYCNSMP